MRVCVKLIEIRGSEETQICSQKIHTYCRAETVGIFQGQRAQSWVECPPHQILIKRSYADDLFSNSNKQGSFTLCLWLDHNIFNRSHTAVHAVTCAFPGYIFFVWRGVPQTRVKRIASNPIALFKPVREGSPALIVLVLHAKLSQGKATTYTRWWALTPRPASRSRCGVLFRSV